MLWLALNLVDLSLAVHDRSRPSESPAPPLAVVQDGRVLAANAPATTEGVRLGQRTASAVALCPTVRFLEHLPAANAQLLRQLAESCFMVTPTVVLAPPQAILLEVAGSLALFGGMPGLLRRLDKKLRHFQVRIVMAQAPTPKAALLLASSPQAEESLRIEAHAAFSAYLPLLRRVPLVCLPWEAALHKRLQQLQFDVLGELLALPRASLSKRLGVGATHYLAALLGEIPDVQQPLLPAETFEASLVFLDGISHTEGLRFPMQRLLDDFCRFLRQRQWRCTRFSWRFSHQDKSRQQLLISSAQGEPQLGRFMALTGLRLENFTISAPVDSLTLEAREFEAKGDTRLSLLPEPGQEDGAATELLDRLRARLGEDACLRVSARNSQRPEQAQVLAPGWSAPAVAPTSHAPRPCWLFPEPKALRLIDGQLWSQGAFTLLRPLERMELPRWDEGDTRDYWLARHDSGAHYWLYFSDQQQTWYCQGMFG